jgi:ferredoxin/flavodoxin
MNFQKVSVVYFSGTGGTKRVAEASVAALKKRSHEVLALPVDQSSKCRHEDQERASFEASDAMMLVFAVHAFDAPEPVYRWIEGVSGNGRRTAVISVSGGGDVWPNTGCRQRLIARLTEKGFIVDYEKMMVMPCNWVVPVNDDMAMHLIQAVAGKVDQIVERFLAGEKRHSPQQLSWLRKKISEQEKIGARSFAQKMTLDENCSGCGWCADYCPVNNIRLDEERKIPLFGDNCVMCFRCIYGCPRKAMHSEDFQVLKIGFDLKAVERRMAGKELKPVAECCKGIAWSGVRRYLDDSDGY